jgi:anti-sigma factor RsiW
VTTIGPHVETALVPYVRDELALGERARVETHLTTCGACREALVDVRSVLAALTPAPAPVEPHWGRYRAELRARLDVLRGGTPWWRRPASIVVTTGLAAAVLVLTLQPAPVEHRAPDLTPIDETTIGARLDMLEHYDVVQRLDLLEELDVIRQLDRLRGR